MKKIFFNYLSALFILIITITGCVFSTDENPVVSTEGYIPFSPLPAVNEAGLNIILELKWSANEGDTFNVYLDTDNPPLQKIASNIAARKFNVAGLQYGTTYY